GQLIEQLDAPDFRERERAEQALRRMGRAALEPLRNARSDPRPEVSSRAESILQQIETDLAGEGIRRLMAIRTLGERRVEAAIPALKTLLDSQDAFVAEHARRSIARIEGRSIPTHEIAPEARGAQLAMLPDTLGVVAQTILPASGAATNLRETFRPIAEAFGAEQDIESMLDEMTRGLLEVANRTGNLRVNLITLGVSGDVDNQPHFIVLVQGQWNASSVGTLLAEQVEAARVIEDASVYPLGGEAAVIIASDTQAALVIASGEPEALWTSVVRAMRTGQGGFAGSDLAKLVRPEHTSADTWVVARITESYRREEFFRAFDDLWETGHRQDGKARIAGAARGSDRDAVEQRLVQMKAGVDEALGDLRQMARNAPQAKPALDLLESMRFEMDGTTIRASAEIEGDPRMIVGAMLMGMSGRARAVPPPDVEAVPVPIDPVDPAPQPVEPDR
ncbi:MAG TPA: HEAT repeat domain-containing protein, partial [Tepidisphaeraceae bacterium]|nr:HEAT repeat domain-containing protein [Tepidisphaeraceae bacterium]